MGKLNKIYDVFCLGNYCIDIIVKPIDSFPIFGGGVTFDTYKITTGGCGNNTAISLARLGQVVIAAGLIGSDQLGNQIIETLASNNIDTKGMIIHPELSTNICIVLINFSGERGFIYNIGVNTALSPSYLDWDIIAQSRILHISGVGLYQNLEGESLAKVLQKAQNLGLSTSIDTVLNPKCSNSRSIFQSFPYINYFLPSLNEAAALAGTNDPTLAAETFLKEGVNMVVIKMGEKGSYLATPNEHWQIPAFKVETIDTCGAGDAFVAGFITGILKGWKSLKAVQLANAVGAICVTDIGATTSVTSFSKTLKFINENESYLQKPTQIK
jgi:sugar/nucleoside kinase (ribokinase family)